MSHDSEEQFLFNLKSSLDKLDDKLEITPPGMDEIRKLVDRVEDRKKKKRDLQFLAFIISASFAVSLEVLAFSKLTLATFSLLQIAAVVCFPAFLLVKALLRHRRMEGT